MECTGATEGFLYERAGAGKVRLKAGVTYGLQRFQPLVKQLARSHWLGRVMGTGATWASWAKRTSSP